MRAAQLVAMVVMVTGVMSLAVPSEADALLRIGADARWAPVAVESMEQEGEELDARRNIDSGGVGVRALVGFEALSLGGRVNFSRHVFEDNDLSFSQLDANAHIRSMVPWTRVNFFGEAGPSIALDIGEVGFNAAAGVEVDLLGWPLVDLNLGLSAQYAYVPIGAGPDTIRDHHSLRAMVSLGADIAILQ